MTTMDHPEPPDREPTPAPPVPERTERGATGVALVFAGGGALTAEEHARVRAELAEDGLARPLVIAADSGLELALTGAWAADLVVGDLDSADPRLLDAAEAAGARIERHPAAKDATDLELALDAALDAGVTRVVVVGGHGGRLDHELANIALLGAARYASLTISAAMGPAWVHVVRHRAAWSGQRGDLVTLLALHGPVAGITTTGLLYPLDGATLSPGSTRGVSNEHLEPDAGVEVATGTLVVVRPGASGTHAAGATARAPAAPAPAPDDPGRAR